MISFVLLAAVLTVAVVALVAVPLLRKSPVELSPAPWAAIGRYGAAGHRLCDPVCLLE